MKTTRPSLRQRVSDGGGRGGAVHWWLKSGHPFFSILSFFLSFFLPVRLSFFVFFFFLSLFVSCYFSFSFFLFFFLFLFFSFFLLFVIFLFLTLFFFLSLECSKEIFEDFVDVEHRLDNLLEQKLPLCSASCNEFQKQAEQMSQKRKVGKAPLTRTFLYYY